MFVPGKPFQPSLLFVGTMRSMPWSLYQMTVLLTGNFVKRLLHKLFDFEYFTLHYQLAWSHDNVVNWLLLLQLAFLSTSIWTFVNSFFCSELNQLATFLSGYIQAWSRLKYQYRKPIRYDSISIRFVMKFENLEMIPKKKTIRFWYIFPHILRKIGTILIHIEI